MNRRAFLRTVTKAAAVASLGRLPDARGEESRPSRLTLAAVGDCILGRRFAASQDPGIRSLASLLRGTDAVWGNFELVQPAPQAADPRTVLAPWPAEELRLLGVRLMGTANNHSLDYGDEGLLALLANLERAGIAHAGTGTDLDQAAQPSWCETRAGRIADINCASTFPDGFPASPSRSYRKGRSGLNPLHADVTVQVGRDLFARLKELAARLEPLQDDPETRALIDSPEPPGSGDTVVIEGAAFQAGDGVGRLSVPRPADLRRITQAIRSARPGARAVIASIHSHEGRSVLEQPAPFLPRFAHACIDAGADLVLGTGPHVLRGIEMYKGRPIFYSLGNFIFHYQGEKVGFHKQKRFWQSAVPLLTWEADRLTGIELHPITLGFGQPAENRGTPRLAHGREAEEILSRLAELCRPYGTEVEIEGETGRVRLVPR